MTRGLGRISLIFLLLRLCPALSSMDFYELNKAQYDFDINTKPLVLDEIPEDNDTMITVHNKKGQKFVCTLPERPIPEDDDKIEGTSANPRNAADILMKSLTKCIKLSTGWWTYTLCPRKDIVQSHGNVGDVDYVANSLGIFSGQYAMPTTRQSKTEKVLYLEEKYEKGEICDITSTPRKSIVQYSCELAYGANDASIYAVDEHASCEYTVFVKTGALCSLSQFQPPRPPESQPIKCSPVISSIIAAKLKNGELIKMKNKEKAKRELLAIKEEYEELKVRRWSIERRRLELMDEEFNLKMRDLDEYYIDLTRDQLEWNIIAKTGHEPPADVKETIHDLLDSMEAIETAQVFYDSMADEDRANLWYFFHNPKRRSDGFPLLLDEVDLRNGFVLFMDEIVSSRHIRETQRERLKYIRDNFHPSRVESVIAYIGAEEFVSRLEVLMYGAMEATTPAVLTYPAEPPLYQELFMTMTLDEMELIIREALRDVIPSTRPSKEKLCRLLAHFWAIMKVRAMDPKRNEWKKTSEINDAIVVAESTDRLLTAWKYFDSRRIADQAEADLNKEMRKEEFAEKYGIHLEELERVDRANGDFLRYYELSERARDAVERRKTMDEMVQAVEEETRWLINTQTVKALEFIKPALRTMARKKLPVTSSTTKLFNELGQESAIAVFRESVDARLIMNQLEEAGLGGDTVKLQIHIKDGHALTAEDDKLIKELIDQEMKEARVRKRTKRRQKAYDTLVTDEEEYQLL